MESYPLILRNATVPHWRKHVTGGHLLSTTETKIRFLYAFI